MKLFKLFNKINFIDVVATGIFSLLVVSVFILSKTLSNYSILINQNHFILEDPLVPTYVYVEPSFSKWIPTPKPTPIPLGYVGSSGGMMVFNDPIGLNYKVPEGWIVERREPNDPKKDHVVEINIYEPNADFNSMINYDFMEINVPVLIKGEDPDILSEYQKKVSDLKIELENNPPKLGSIEYSLGQVNGYPALFSVYEPGDPPDWWQGSWSYKTEKTAYIQVSDNLVLTVWYWWWSDERELLFEQILKSIEFN